METPVYANVLELLESEPMCSEQQLLVLQYVVKSDGASLTIRMKLANVLLLVHWGLTLAANQNAA